MERLLRGQPKLLKGLFGKEVEKRLADFDANARRTLEGGFRRGFIDGAASANDATAAREMSDRGCSEGVWSVAAGFTVEL